MGWWQVNGIAALLLAGYLGAVAYNGQLGGLWDALKVDAPNMIPWLISLFLLVLLYQARGFFGPGSTVIAATIIAGVLAVMLLSAPALSIASRDLNKVLTGDF